LLNPNEPLWLPRGTVRAIIALFTVIAVTSFLILQGGDAATTALAATLGVVIGYYFAKRDAEDVT